MARVLIIAYGNPMRCDDGLAWRAADEFERKLSDFEVEILRAASAHAGAGRNRRRLRRCDFCGRGRCRTWRQRRNRPEKSAPTKSACNEGPPVLAPTLSGSCDGAGSATVRRRPSRIFGDANRGSVLITENRSRLRSGPPSPRWWLRIAALVESLCNRERPFLPFPTRLRIRAAAMPL